MPRTSGGWGSTGDVSIQSDKFDQVKTVWRLAVRYAGGRTIAYFCILGILALLLSLWRGWAWVWWAFLWTVEILASILLIIWGHAFWKASREYYAVAIRNPAWPLPYGQVDPHVAGIAGARDFPTEEIWEDASPLVTRFQGTVVMPDGSQLLANLETTTPEKWLRYAKALTRPVFPVQFSGNVAEHVFHIDRAEYKSLSDSMVINRMAYRTSYKVNARTYLHPAGKEWFRSLLRGQVQITEPTQEAVQE